MQKKTMLWSVMQYLTPTEQLLIAAEKGCVRSIRNLITKHGANPYSKDSEGNTSLHLAARNGHLFACEFLVAELNTNAKNTRDKCEQIMDTRFDVDHNVRIQRLEHIVENKNKAPLDERNDAGQTALFLATLLGRHCPQLSKQQHGVLETVFNPVIALLAESGAQITEQDLINCKIHDNDEGLKILQKSKKPRNCKKCPAAKTCMKLKVV